MAPKTETGVWRSNRGDPRTAKIYLKLDGIPGDSKAPRHTGEIECTTFSLEPLAGGGSGIAHADRPRSVYVAAPLESKLYAKLKLASDAGTRIAKAVVTIEAYDAGRLAYTTRITMTGLLLPSVQLSGKVGGVDLTMAVELLPSTQVIM